MRFLSMPPRAVALLGLCFATLAMAEEAACPPVPTRAPRAAIPADAPTEVNAGELRARRGGVSEFAGQVELRRAGERLSAERVRYDEATDTAEAEGAVTLEEAAGDRIETERLRLKLDTREGETAPATFRLGPSPGQARGEAKRIELAGRDLTRLENVSYTTCAPGQDSWFLHVKELELDTAKDTGMARHAWVEFQGAPIFYFPYATFPLSDQRKSGFLAPRAGHEAKQGAFIATPYYFNLAPNYDATVTPRYMTDRGLMLQNEFRYLGRASSGQATLDWLPDDDLTGDQRAAGSLRFDHRPGAFWTMSVDTQAVSDKTYLEDFGESLSVTSQTHLPINAALGYRGTHWSFDARAAAYQTVDPNIVPADKPYERLPQLSLAWLPDATVNRPRLHFDAEATYFTREDSVTGARVNANPAVSLPLANRYGFVTPKLGARYIGYNLSSAPDETPSVAAGVFSLDSGLVFERDTARGAQTLEPRLFYLFVPAKNQDDQPSFDTSIPDFSFESLFRENRFIGGDRIADANQLTAALTTRLLDGASGAERLRLSVGETLYFDDREVNLPAGVDASSSSDLSAEAIAWLPGYWHLSAAAQWDETAKRAQKASFYAQYQPARDRIVNLGYRFLRDEVEQTDLSAEWPFTARWRVRARTMYSLREERNVESYAGLEYNACCWRIRAAAARRFLETSGQTDSIEIEFELSGLTRVGSRPQSPLTQSLFSFPATP
jgi:LPS-assembly protein